MKLLLCKNVMKLGIVGDIVDVRPGYGRNYLVPYGLATEPTETNIRALADARKVAEQERAHQRAQLEALAAKLQDVEVTIRAKANEQGHLYGSVGPKEIAEALIEEHHYVDADQVVLSEHIKQLDNVTVDVRLAEDLRASVKVWVVREKEDGEEDAEDSASDDTHSGMEAGTDGAGTEE